MSSLNQGIVLIDAVARRERAGRSGLSVSKLSDASGIERSRVSRLAQELLDLGLLAKHADGLLRIGPAYFSMGASRHDDWLRNSRQKLRHLASKHRASVRIFAQDGPRAVLLRYESAPGAPDSAIHPGMVTPIWSTAGGRALLWNTSDDAICELLTGSQFIGVGGPHAARSDKEIIHRIKRDHERGFVESVEEFEYGVTELAYPVQVHGKVIAAVSAACPSDDGEACQALSHEVVSVAQQLAVWASSQIGAAD